jgi:hypothetical protein
MRKILNPVCENQISEAKSELFICSHILNGTANSASETLHLSYSSVYAKNPLLYSKSLIWGKTLDRFFFFFFFFFLNTGTGSWNAFPSSCLGSVRGGNGETKLYHPHTAVSIWILWLMQYSLDDIKWELSTIYLISRRFGKKKAFRKLV